MKTKRKRNVLVKKINIKKKHTHTQIFWKFEDPNIGYIGL
jgi:hypothetical protein